MKTVTGAQPALPTTSNPSASAKCRSIVCCASILRTTPRKVRRPPKNELHLGHAVAKDHSLNQCVHFLQLGSLGHHFPTKAPHFGPQGLDFIGLTAPQYHRPPPSLTVRSAPCHNNAASRGHGYGNRETSWYAKPRPNPNELIPQGHAAGTWPSSTAASISACKSETPSDAVWTIRFAIFSLVAGVRCDRSIR